MNEYGDGEGNSMPRVGPMSVCSVLSRFSGGKEGPGWGSILVRLQIAGNGSHRIARKDSFTYAEHWPSSCSRKRSAGS
jgi:hypothetical protein